MIKKILHKRFVAIFTFALLIGVAVFVWQVNQRPSTNGITEYICNAPEYTHELLYHDPNLPMETQADNLQKLAMVWGFTMYTHQTFLTGERCWDEELIGLIPIVRWANPEDVNDILYDWFVGLGDDGYDFDYSALRALWLGSSPEDYELVADFFSDTDNHNWAAVEGLYDELWLLNTGRERILRQMADLNWINEGFLGGPLAASLSRFYMIQTPHSSASPVHLDVFSMERFANKERFVEIDYANYYHRLLGLFRLWNTINYFFPYLDIIDYDWNALLLEYIPKMLEGIDRFSYEVTLVTLASKLQDTHIHFIRSSVATVWPPPWSTTVEREIIEQVFGSYFAPVVLREADGYLVVNSTGYGLEPGDVIRRVNGTAIDDITTAMLHYLPYPNTDKALSFLVRDHVVLRQHSNTTPMEIEVYRFGEVLTIYVSTDTPNQWFFYTWHYTNPANSPYVILENNIGLINPSMIMFEELYRNDLLRSIMETFENADIDGLIIDLRQGTNGIFILLPEYLLNKSGHFATGSFPFWLKPGIFVDSYHAYSGYGTLASYGSFGSFFHNLDTVLLMNEYTQSEVEYTVMALLGGANVTVMGTNSIGANGNVVFLPLPGGITMIYTGLGIYTPDGGQTQRIGLSPDIYVPRTIAGIRDGKDVLMDAAIQFLLE